MFHMMDQVTFNMKKRDVMDNCISKDIYLSLYYIEQNKQQKIVPLLPPGIVLVIKLCPKLF